MFSPRPVDMTTSRQETSSVTNTDTSPPPLTKLVHRKPSSPREFFEKLYGPDTKDTKDTAKDTAKGRDAEDGSPSPPLSPDPDLAKTHGHPHHGAGGLAAAAAGGGYHHLNLNNNGPASLVGVAGAGLHPSPSSSYLPAFPLPPHEVGILNMDNVPFPGGLAAFCKSLKDISCKENIYKNISVARRARKDARARRQRTTFSQEQTALLEVSLFTQTSVLN